MAGYTQSERRSFKAAADLTALQFTAVKLDSNGNIVAAVAATDQVIGFTENAPKLNDTGDVYLRNGSGTCKAKAGATFAPGVKLMIDASGRVITAATTGNEIVGISIEAGVVGQIVEIMPCVDRV